MEFSAVARNDIEIVSEMSKKLSVKLKKTTNIINDVCNFIETEATKITRNSCNKFNTFVMPCPVVGMGGGGGSYGVSGWQQHGQTAKSNLVFDPTTINTIANNNLNANHKMDILNYLNLTTTVGTNNHGYNNNNLASGMTLNQDSRIPTMKNSDNKNKIYNANGINANNNNNNNNVDDSDLYFGGDDDYEKNVLNNKLQDFITKRFNDEYSKSPQFNENIIQYSRRTQMDMLNVKQHYFLSKYDQLTDNKCQYYFDDTHLR